MKTVILGKVVHVSFEVQEKPSGEPFIKEVVNTTNLEYEIKSLESDFEVQIGDKISLDKNTDIIVTEIKKTLDGVKYVYTDYMHKITNDDDLNLCNIILEKKLVKFSENLLKQYPNISNLMNIMSIEKTPQNIIATTKAMNGVSNDFFVK